MSYVPTPPGEPPSPPPEPKKGHALELIVGALGGGVALIVFGLGGIAVSAGSDQFFLAGLVIGPVLALLIMVGMLFAPATRWWGIGLLIGYFLTLIILGGACVALIAAMSGGGGYG